MKSKTLLYASFAITALALTSQSANAAACPTATVSTYLAGNFTCTIGGLTFSAFQFSSSGSTGIVIPNTGVMVTPVTNSHNEGFQLSGSWNTAAANTTQDTTLFYTVTAGATQITGARLFGNPALTNTTSSQIAEFICPTGAVIGCLSPLLLNVATPAVPNASMTFPATATVGVSQDVSVSVAASGLATVSQTIATFQTATPPSFAQAFGLSAIPVLGTLSAQTTSLTFVISNNQGAFQTALSGLAFTDKLPAGLQLSGSSSNSCGGALVAANQTDTITLSGGTLAVGGICTIAVGIAPLTSGIKMNPLPNLATTEFGTLVGATNATLTVLGSSGVDLTLFKTHQGNFTPSQQNAVMRITVTNSGSGASSGAVLVTDTLPAGMTAVSFSGTGWTGCTLGVAPTCTRSDALAAGSSYPELQLVVNLAGATTPLVNTVAVSSGSDVDLTNNTRVDQITVQAAPAACPAQTPLTTYLAGGFTCTINNLVFSNFTFSPTATGTAAVPVAGNVIVVAITTLGLEGFNFVGGLGASSSGGAASSQDQLITFDVRTLDLSSTLQGLNLTGIIGITSTGSGVVTDSLCPGNTLIACAAAKLTSITNPPSLTSATTTITPAASASVSVDINGTSGTNGTVTIPTTTTVFPNFSASSPANLTVTKTHVGNFRQGDLGDTYTITVTNSGGTATTGNWTVADVLPAGLTLAPPLTATGIVAGNCVAVPASFTCTQNTPIAPGGQVVITLLVNVAPNASASVTNTVTVSGGGEVATNDDTANDVTTIIATADLTITKFHTGTFHAGELYDTFTLTVVNTGGGPTVGTVSVLDTPGTGLIPYKIEGVGWTCTQPVGACTRSDVLAAGASYPPIIFTANIDTRPPLHVYNMMTVSGGGEQNILNNTVIDEATTVSIAPDLTITKSHTGNFKQGDAADTYTITVSNVGTANAQGTVTVVDALPIGLTATAMTGSGWICDVPTKTCTTTATLAPNTSYPVITLTVSVATNAAATLTNMATVSGGTESNTTNDTAADLTLIIPTTVMVTVGTSAPGASFTVDSVPYTSAQTFTWTVGTVHTIATTSPQQVPAFFGPMYMFQSWSDGGLISHSVTAALGTTSYIATFMSFGGR